MRTEDTPMEAEARRKGLAYVDLDGNIGIAGNGAGLVMSTIDVIKYMGGEPSNFLDLGGGGNTAITKQGLLLVMSKPQVKAVLVNVLGGITRCDIVAQAVVEAWKESRVKKPVVVRMTGTNEEEGVRILAEAGIKSFNDMEEAIAKVISVARE